MNAAGRPIPTALFISFVSLTALGCSVGDDALPSTPEPRICSSTLAITGTFAIGAMVPDVVTNSTNEPPADGLPDFTGCWPTGTWTWTMSVAENNCPSPPTPLAEYKFRTDYLPDSGGEPQYSYALLAPQQVTNYRLKVSSGGGGLCEGIMELYSDDGKESWILHAALNTFNASGPLTGEGEYAKWNEAQYP